VSEYSKLKNKGLHRGRPRLSEEERAERKRVMTLRQEARRRALIVLQHRYPEEYEQIMAAEFKELMRAEKQG
jgi:hypothetical protein